MISWSHLVEAILGVFSRKPDPPRQVQDALKDEYDLEYYRESGGGIAPKDAPHIEEGGL